MSEPEPGPGDVDLSALMERLQKLEAKVAAAVPAPEPAPPPASEPPPPTALALPPPLESKQPWLILDILREVRNMFAMFFDMRFRVGWLVRTVVVVLICAVVFLPESWWLPMYWVPLIGTFLVSIVKILVAFFVYKLLSREARRYQAFRAQGPAP